MADSLLSHAPAGQPFQSSKINRIQVTRQVHSRVPITGSHFQSGRSCSFAFSSSPTDCWLPSESRLVVRMKVDNASSGDVSDSVRFQYDPLNSMFDAASHQCQSVTVDSCGSNLVDLSNIQHRLDSSKDGSSLSGSTGLLNFKKHMHGSVLPQDDGVVPETTAATSTGATFGNDLMSVNLFELRREVTMENEKQTILQRNGRNYFELSAPIALPFWRTNTAVGGPLNHVLEMTVAQDYLKRMFYSKPIDCAPSNNAVTLTSTGALALTALGSGASAQPAAFEAGGHHRSITVPLATAQVAAIAVSNIGIEIEDIYLSLCYVNPRAEAIQRPLSFQLPYTGINLLTRTLTNGTTHTEMFTIPLATQMIAVALRSADINNIRIDSEEYFGGQYIRQLQIQRGGESQPTPAYNINAELYQVARPYQAYTQILGGAVTNGKGQSLSEWNEEPVFLFRTMSNELSTSLTIKMTTAANSSIGGGSLTASNFELMVWCFSQEVVEVRLDESGNVRSVIKDSVAGV